MCSVSFSQVALAGVIEGDALVSRGIILTVAERARPPIIG
jgi:hypothetical protein